MWTVIPNEMKEKGKKKDTPPATEEGGETHEEEEAEENLEPAPVEGDKKKHGFLILSREDSTMVHLPPHLYTVQYTLHP
jgi:hypothetical protein